METVRAWLWASIYSIMLVLLLTPLSPFLFLFVIVPLVVLFSRVPVAQTIIPLVAILGVYCLIFWPIGQLMVLISMFLLLPGLVMGIQNRKKLHAGVVIFSGFAIILGQFVLMLLIAALFFDFNFIQWLSNQLDAAFRSLELLYGILYPNLNVSEQATLIIELIRILFTSFLLVFSVVLSWVTYMVARWLLSKQRVEIGEYLPIREWRLPRSLIWYNILTIILSLLVTDKTSFLYALHMNMFVLLLLLFWVQGIGFFFFYCFRKKWNRSLPVIGICLSVFTPILYLFALLGLIDMLFPLRQKMTGET